MSAAELRRDLSTERETERLGAHLAEAAITPLVIFLSGDLAAGKTTLSRGYLRAHGHLGAVKSPTFTLVETYELENRVLHHFDLYRISDAEELDYIGLDEYFDNNADCLVEWPERGMGVLPMPDLRIQLAVVGAARRARIEAASDAGAALILRLPTL